MVKFTTITYVTGLALLEQEQKPISLVDITSKLVTSFHIGKTAIDAFQCGTLDTLSFVKKLTENQYIQLATSCTLLIGNELMHLT